MLTVLQILSLYQSDAVRANHRVCKATIAWWEPCVTAENGGRPRSLLINRRNATDAFNHDVGQNVRARHFGKVSIAAGKLLGGVHTARGPDRGLSFLLLWRHQHVRIVEKASTMMSFAHSLACTPRARENLLRTHPVHPEGHSSTPRQSIAGALVVSGKRLRVERGEA